MHGHRVSHIDDPGPLRLSPMISMAFLAVGTVGMIAFLYRAFTGDDAARTDAWAGFLVSTAFFWFLAMGAAAWLAIQYVVGAKWFVVMKRLPEAIASFAWRGGFVFPLLTIFGLAAIYPWAAPDATYPYEGMLKKTWLSPNVHTVKLFVYILPLAGLTFLLLKLSTSGSEGRVEEMRLRRLRVSIIFLIAFAFLFSLFSWEAVMSVEPKWFSTMFGVYCFSGAIQSALALMMLLAFYLRGRVELIPHRQMYDMGTYVMCFSVFMAYIGFSQFMLIWYANIPEETFFYLDRYKGGYDLLTIALAVFKFGIPFLLLMPPPMRTNLYAQGIACGAILLGQLLDLYWIIFPAMPMHEDGFTLPNLWNVLTFIGVGGFFGWSILTFLGSHSLLPVKDADLLSSVNGDYLHA